ncbi:hypothetical protein EXU57_02910 [Segetibacter sp. 3557_3]|uniref:hypothetical protein n=1 Tax=Segetibacter sp. 3557_3 TaxID=2547429 RepID=UPI001058F5B4|nr:hypothetical protein [Segetibacter sp. 3557_3]TDH29040.1 hypothetical protein EXU57_02910 [Segetibacter sp. 3557_3]
MIKFNELKIGDLVIADFDGQKWEGEVVRLNGDEKQVCVRTEVQEFWFEREQLFPITLDEAQLFKLGFQKQENEDGSIKYSKGAFRVLLHSANDFSNFEMWYREDRRHISAPIFVHEFQNKYLQMTKVQLTPA